MYKTYEEKRQKQQEDSAKIVFICIIGAIILLLTGFILGGFEQTDDIVVNPNRRTITNDNGNLIGTLTIYDGDDYILVRKTVKNKSDKSYQHLNGLLIFLEGKFNDYNKY